MAHAKLFFMAGMKECPTFPGYAATEEGDVYRIIRTHAHDRRVPYRMKPRYDKDGYLIVGKGLRVQRIVAETYIPNPSNKPQVAHNNGVRDDNRVVNLRWATTSENHKDKRIHGTQPFGFSHPDAKLSEAQLFFAKGLAEAGFSHTEIAPMFQISREGLSKALRGATYK